MIRLSCRNDPNSLVPPGEYHHKYAPHNVTPDCDEALFEGEIVLYCQRPAVLKHLSGVLKVDAVFPEVGAGFAWVPLVIDRHVYAQVYIETAVSVKWPLAGWSSTIYDSPAPIVIVTRYACGTPARSTTNSYVVVW